MQDEPITLQLHATPSGKGIEVLAITAGIGNGWIFNPSVLQASLSMWDKAECYTDHTTDHHSVRDLGGILSAPTWDDMAQGIKAVLSPTGPAAQVVRDLAEAALAHPELPIGLSADILMRVDEKTVLEIIKVKSLDIVTHPARGGKFVRVQQAHQAPACHADDMSRRRQPQQGEPPMSDPVTSTPIEPTDPAPSQGGVKPPLAALAPRGAEDPVQSKLESAREKLKENSEAMAAFLGEQARQDKLQAQIAQSDKVLAEQCRYLLNTALGASRLPEVTQARLRKTFEGTVFEPLQLQAAIEEARLEVSALTGPQAVQGPSRIHGMFSSEDHLQAAFDDLLGAPRDADKAGLKVARLSGIREAYLMLTGDYDFHGGFDPIRAQLATTSDFTGLVKNALNKVIVASFEKMGRAGYDWWKSIVKTEHFESLNAIIGTLVGTIGSLPSVAEQAEYTELAVGDSPETASFTKYGGYLPLTLEAIDRDETRKLRLYAIELGNAAMRNISEQVAYIFTQNSAAGPTMADTGALFNATAVTTAGGHANLLTAALAADKWDLVAAAVYNQPMLIKNATGYYGTGKKLAIEPRFCLIPRALKKTAFDLFLNAWDVTSQVHAENLLKGSVVPLIVPEWTDATDFAAVCDPDIAPAIILGERFGLVPEVYIAGRETDPAVFMNDEHRLKVRQFLALCVGDFRPLHKSNVAG
jgi:hypothetical protein